MFSDAVARVLEHEGGYVPPGTDDPGGETNFGISKRAYPDVDIAALTVEDAMAIYRRDYWAATNVDALPAAVRGTVFDMAVNGGPVAAVKCLQETVNAFNVSQVAVDGGLGPITLAATDAVDPHALLRAYTARRAMTYMQIAAARPQMKQYLRGWLRRAYSWLD